jgi:hypothetical protein
MQKQKAQAGSGRDSVMTGTSRGLITRAVLRPTLTKDATESPGMEVVEGPHNPCAGPQVSPLAQDLPIARPTHIL